MLRALVFAVAGVAKLADQGGARKAVRAFGVPHGLTGAVALIWNGQTIGNSAATTADVIGSVFSVAFFAAFVLRMVEELSGDS